MSAFELAISVFYVSSVAGSALLTSTTLSHKPVFQTLTSPFLPRPKAALLASIVSEYSIFVLLSKLFILYELSGQSFFNGFWMSTLYRFDIAIILILWGLFLQAVFARHPIYEASKFMRNSSSTIPPSIFSWSFWFRFANPFWHSRSLLIHESSKV